MKLYIPEIGDTIRLTDNWAFNLQDEYRNKSLWELLECDSKSEVLAHKNKQSALSDELNRLEAKMYPGNVYWRNPANPVDPVDHNRRLELYELLREQPVVPVMLPAGSVLSIDRIFIRKGANDWSSLTFFLKEHPTLSFKKKPRFWVNLPDCNKIEFEPVTT